MTAYYPFTMHDFKRVLQLDGRKMVRAGKGVLTNCLVHQDRNPSAEVFPDGWIACYSCGKRYHISNFYPDLRDPDWKPENSSYTPNLPNMPKPLPVPTKHQDNQEYKTYDLMEEWKKLPEIPRHFDLKGIPLEVLDGLGWRRADSFMGMGSGILIPYFNASRTKIPFAQVRHISGPRRFTFLPGAETSVYGKWNLHPGEKLFLVEGCSDAAVMEYAMVPWVAMPSASSGSMLENLARYCLKNQISIVYAGDNDEAGEKLRSVIDEIMPYRVCQPPKKYKDWGDFLVGEGIGKVQSHCMTELSIEEIPPMMALAASEFDVKTTQEPMV